MSDGRFSNRNFPSGVNNPVPTSDSGSKSYELSGKIMISVIIVLFFVIVIVVGLHIYARWYLLRARRRQLLRHRNRSSESRRTSQFVFYSDNPSTLIFADSGNQGLNSEVLGSIPVFVYSSKTHPENLDCAVCLSEFEENEKGRVLPKCNHYFHIGCIDMWFHSHSTCPLCRTPVEQVSEPETNGSGLVESGRTGNEPAASSSGFCFACQQEEGDSSTTSLRSRRKGLDVSRIEVPLRNELDNELSLSSPASGRRGYKSPGTRLLSMGMKRIVSFGGRKTPTCESSSTSTSLPEEVDLEKGPSELTQK